MYICPICKSEIKNIVCLTCGHDLLLDVENNRFLSRLNEEEIHAYKQRIERESMLYEGKFDASFIKEQSIALQVGEEYSFGIYCFGNNQLKPIEWYVADVQDNKAYLISKNIIDIAQFDHIYDEWLDKFKSIAFKMSDFKRIIDGQVKILDQSDYQKYAKVVPFAAIATPFAINKGLWKSPLNQCSMYWCDNKDSSNFISYINFSGTLDTIGMKSNNECGIRVALWISL